MAQVKSIEQLKEMIANGTHDFFISLNGGLRSSKEIDYNPETKTFYILNEIDDTEQELTEEQLMDEAYTNIGYAMTQGSFHSYEYKD